MINAWRDLRQLSGPLVRPCSINFQDRSTIETRAHAQADQRTPLRLKPALQSSHFTPPAALPPMVALRSYTT